MADLTTLQTWLTEAEAAYHKLTTQGGEEEVQHGDMRVRYTRGDLDKLGAYIINLKAQIAGLGGTTTGLRRRAIEVDL